MEHNFNSSVQKNVMRRVRIIRNTRTVLSAPVGTVLIVALALYGIGREVWVARVFENMPSPGQVTAFYQFWFSAFVDTRTSVQVLVVACVVGIIYLARETARMLAPRLVAA